MCKSRSKGYGCVCWFLGLFWTIETVRESLVLEVLNLFLYAIILFLANRNVMIDKFSFMA
jgi:hypothetical protein